MQHPHRSSSYSISIQTPSSHLPRRSGARALSGLTPVYVSGGRLAAGKYPQNLLRNRSALDADQGASGSLNTREK